MAQTQNPKAQAQAQTPELVKIEELPQVEFKTWRLYSADGKALPLYVRCMGGGTWWALVPLRELGVALGGAQAQAIIVTAESAAAAANALWRLLNALGVEIECPALAGPA